MCLTIQMHMQQLSTKRLHWNAIQNETHALVYWVVFSSFLTQTPPKHALLSPTRPSSIRGCGGSGTKGNLSDVIHWPLSAYDTREIMPKYKRYQCNTFVTKKYLKKFNSIFLFFWFLYNKRYFRKVKINSNKIYLKKITFLSLKMLLITLF